VLIEKPMATTVAEARALMAAEQKAGKQIMVDFTMRFSPPTSVIARMARNGEFGNIICLGGNYVHDMWHYYNPEGGTWYSPWRSDPKHPQSPLVGGGCHGLDLMLWIQEGVAVEEVFAYATELSQSGLPIPDTYTLVMRFADGALGKVFVTTGACGASGSMLEVYGTTGSSVGGMIMRRDELPVPLEVSEEDQKGAAHGWPLAVKSFLDFLDGKTENPVPSRMGALNIAVFEAALESIRTGRPVRPEQF
jgi:predicted dehydrogenase